MRKIQKISENYNSPNGHYYFDQALSRSECDRELVKTLRELHTEAVSLRRKGKLSEAETKYKELVELAKNSKDQSKQLQYYAAETYNSFLVHYLYLYRQKEKYLKYREQIPQLAIAKEIGKQALISKAFLTAGGDWSRLEKVFQELEEQSILIHRVADSVEIFNVQLEKQLNKKLIGEVSFDKSHIKDGIILALCCSGALELTKCSNCGFKHTHASKNPQRVVKLLASSLQKAGFKTKVDGEHVFVIGKWTRADKPNYWIDYLTTNNDFDFIPKRKLFQKVLRERSEFDINAIHAAILACERFDTIDSDRDGFITSEEISNSLKNSENKEFDWILQSLKDSIFRISVLHDDNDDTTVSKISKDDLQALLKLPRKNPVRNRVEKCLYTRFILKESSEKPLEDIEDLGQG